MGESVQPHAHLDIAEHGRRDVEPGCRLEILESRGTVDIAYLVPERRYELANKPWSIHEDTYVSLSMSKSMVATSSPVRRVASSTSHST